MRAKQHSAQWAHLLEAYGTLCLFSLRSSLFCLVYFSFLALGQLDVSIATELAPTEAPVEVLAQLRQQADRKGEQQAEVGNRCYD